MSNNSDFIFDDVDEELEDFSLFYLSDEELEMRKQEEDKRIIEKGFLPRNKELEESMTSPQEYVENNPKKYIIEECIPACKELWRKNIYTFMVSDHLNEGECWIEVISDSLSEENKEVFMNLEGEDVIKFSYHKGCINFGVKYVGKKGQERLLELARKFKMQDVPKEQAYITHKDFLMNYCGCYDEIPNPDYEEMKSPNEMNLSEDEFLDYFFKYDEWQGSVKAKKTIKKFNPKKASKSVEDLASEHGMIVDGDRIYLSEFHYKKHREYVEYREKEIHKNKRNYLK